ncbi:MAG: ATP-binding protein [Patescibacteria group bacterium]
MDALSIQYTLAFGSLVVVLMMLAFSVWVAIEGRSSDKHLSFAGVIMSVSLWLLAFAFWRLPTLSTQNIFWLRSLYFFGSLIPAFYYLFSLTYLFPRRLPKLIWPMVLLPNIIIGWIAYSDGQIANAAKFNFSLLGGGRTLFAIHFSLFVVASLLMLFYSSRVRKNLDPKELFPVIAGAIIAFHSVFSVLFSSSSAQGASYMMTLVSLIGGIVIITPFIIQRRLLVDLRLVGAEMLILIALFVFVTDIVASAETTFDFVFRLSVLVLLLFYGAMTTRVFVREIKQLQRSEAMQEQIIRMNGRLIEGDRLKTKFVSLVAHQMRSPLTSMHIYMNMARNGEFGKVPKKLDEILKQNMEVLERLIQTSKTFLDVTRIEMGKIDLYEAETDLAGLVERLARECVPMAAKQGLTIKTDIMPDMPPVVCDAGAIFHVLMNMIDNSIKYTPKGSITLKVRATEKQAEVLVIDTGIGMTELDLDSVFRIFQRGMSAVKLESKGEGLGVFIAKQFIDAHGGEVIAESVGKNQGSTFGFRIPLEGLSKWSEAKRTVEMK